MRRPMSVRNYDAALRLLAERGHHVHLAFESVHKRLADQWGPAERLSDESPNVTYGLAPPEGRDAWARFAMGLRLGLDHLFYRQPQYRETPSIPDYLEARVPPVVVRLAASRLLSGPRGRRLLQAVLRALEAALPRRAGVDAFMREHAPDVVAMTPLAQPGTPQAELIRSAAALGVPSAGCIASWDNLTTGGWIREVPDVVTVWNEIQRGEAVELHGLPAERVVATGAQAWDHWFDWSPSTERAEFCAKVGLRPDRPFLLFLGSSGYVNVEREADFVAEWVRRAREDPDGRLSHVGVLVRPHPLTFETHWPELLALGLDEVTVWPAAGAEPAGPGPRADYYDSMFHSAGVFGVNTSAFIESAIVGRTAHTVLLPEFAHAQQDMLHFRYLRHENGGPLRIAGSWDEHLAQLADTLADPARDQEHARRFVSSFVRPDGLDVPATPKLVAVLEGLAEVTPRPAPEMPAWARSLRVALTPAVLGAHAWGSRHATVERGRAGAGAMNAAVPWPPRAGCAPALLRRRRRSPRTRPSSVP